VLGLKALGLPGLDVLSFDFLDPPEQVRTICAAADRLRCELVDVLIWREVSCDSLGVVLTKSWAPLSRCALHAGLQRLFNVTWLCAGWLMFCAGAEGAGPAGAGRAQLRLPGPP
jgi:hypothetical protein